MRRAGNNATYRLTAQDREHVAILCELDLWPSTAIAAAYGCDASNVRRLRDRRRARLAEAKAAATPLPGE